MDVVGSQHGRDGGRLSVGEEAGEALSEAADALGTHFVLTKAAPWHRRLCKGEGIGQRLGFAKGQRGRDGGAGKRGGGGGEEK